MAIENGKEMRLMKGNEALAEAAFRAGMKAYFGYPITPQSEILEYLLSMPRSIRMWLSYKQKASLPQLIWSMVHPVPAPAS